MRYEVWVAGDGCAVPDQIIVEAPDADTAILRAGMTYGPDYDGMNLTVVDVPVFAIKIDNGG